MNPALLAGMGALYMMAAQGKLKKKAKPTISPDGNCPGCGAPLEPSISPNVLVIECEYCNRKVAMR